MSGKKLAKNFSPKRVFLYRLRVFLSSCAGGSMGRKFCVDARYGFALDVRRRRQDDVGHLCPKSRSVGRMWILFQTRAFFRAFSVPSRVNPAISTPLCP